MTPDFEKLARNFCNKGPISVETLAELIRDTYEDGYWDALWDFNKTTEEEEHF